MEALKKSYKSYLVALLVVIFIGIAGGFTNTERGIWRMGSGTCSVTVPEANYDPDKDADDYLDLLRSGLTEEDYCVTRNSGVWTNGEEYWQLSVKGTRTQHFNGDSRIVFDPKSTALYVIAGAVVALVGLEVKRKKRG
jgi:hypothetical protein